VLLAHVESSFDVTASSKAGAAGMWQFTRATGKKYLTVNRVLDERRDPIRASEAAAKLLKQNYERLRNWPMALTAYNHGVAGVLRAKEAMGTYEALFETTTAGSSSSLQELLLRIPWLPDTWRKTTHSISTMFG